MAVFDLSAKIVISVRNQQKLDQSWQRHGQTEVSEVSIITNHNFEEKSGIVFSKIFSVYQCNGSES